VVGDALPNATVSHKIQADTPGPANNIVDNLILVLLMDLLLINLISKN